MSKRKSIGASNTLFNYFSSVNSKPKQAKDTSANASDLDSSLMDEENSKTKSNKRERQNTPPCEANSDSDENTPISAKKRKRIRLRPIDSDDSDVENKVDNTIGSEKKTVTEKLNESFKFEANQTPRAKKPVDSTNVIKGTPKPVAVEKIADNDDGNWVHCKLEWLKPHKIMDAQKRRPDDPAYDPTTLFVPQNFLEKQTPGHKQWWEMKSLHYDCVLFFKVGKFYELYHMDAAVGVKELGFSYMKGEFAHSGFPESAYARMVSTLVAKGYKVARVEQTETPEMMKERCKNSRQKVCDKVVRREICQVTVKGVQVCGLQDPGPADAAAQYLMTVVEEERMGYSVYGVCFLDTSIGLFHLGQFKDDKHSSRLLITFAHYPPALIVYDRKCTSVRTMKLISSHAPGARKEPLSMWAPDKTLKTLAEKYYRTDADGDWPEGLKPYLYEGDALGLTPAANCSLAIKALGGCVAYLTECLLDIQVLGMSQFSTYEPPDALNKTLSQEDKVENSQENWKGSNSMVLDAITLRNLRIVQDEGCLYDKLNSCSTAMGKRLLYQWVCAPSCNLKVIEQRQEAVKELFNNQELCQDAKKVLSTLPDLERLLAKVHGLGNSMKSKVHPDSRAILYEEKIYSKRKVLDFISVLNGFTAALELVELFSNTDPKMLKLITQYAPEGKFPDYRSTLKFFKEGFDQTEAQKEGRILPGVGVDPQYDNALQVIEDIEREAKQYLAEQEKYFRCRLSYVGTNKKRYQIEVPQSAVSKAGGDYKLEGARKGFKRFSTDESRDILARMLAAEDQKINVLKDLSRRIFEKFSSHYKQWETAVQCIATLDIFLSMAEFARQQTNDVCLPEITFSNKNKPYINIVDGRHPCIPVANEFIPNDTVLGQVSENGDRNETGTLLLLTGPNMGGKSTLMRQVGLLSVLAHLGSYVPASQCRMSLVDRIFTRVGASDDILSGQSTFLVEMNETAAIVNHATVHSLVLLDELGRGTSTYDGTAIASGVCAELATRGCRVVFSTHYHSVVHHLAVHPNVVLGHMACMVETDETSADSDEIPDETITFLYKLTPGACPKSYGFNAARLAGIPKDITTRAHQISKDLEKEATCVRAFRDIFKKERSNAGNVRELLAGLCI